VGSSPSFPVIGVSSFMSDCFVVVRDNSLIDEAFVEPFPFVVGVVEPPIGCRDIS